MTADLFGLWFILLQTRKPVILLGASLQIVRMSCVVDNTPPQRYERNGWHGKINEMWGVDSFLLVSLMIFKCLLTRTRRGGWLTSIGFGRFHPCRAGMNKKGSVKRGVVPVRGVALVRCWTQMKGSYLPSGKLAYPTKREKESHRLKSTFARGYVKYRNADVSSLRKTQLPAITGIVLSISTNFWPSILIHPPRPPFLESENPVFINQQVTCFGIESTVVQHAYLMNILW